MAVLQFPRARLVPHDEGITAIRPAREFAPTNVAPHRPRTADLTWGIRSRQALLERLQLVAEIAPNAPLSFLAIEVAGLYAVNRSADGAGADSLLRGVASRVLELTRSTDMVGRLNASTFGVVLQGIGIAAASRTADELSVALNQLAAGWPGGAISVSAATGKGLNALVLPSAALDSSVSCC